MEVDHTPLNIIVVNPETGLTDGRPNLTVLIDHYSRMPLGFEIGFEPPSQISVIRALRNSILPKDHIKELYPDIDSEWPAYGIMNTLICDNGLEFHSKILQSACNALNIEIQFCPKGMPEYKGTVERFQRTLNRDVCHLLPGTTFSNITERGNYDSEKEAMVTLDELKSLVHEWLINIYCHSIHRTTSKTPFNAWMEGLKRVEPILPESKDQLDLMLTKQESRKLSHKGIEYSGLFYNSSELAVLRQYFDKVDFNVNEQDLGSVWVYDEFADDYFKVDCTEYDYASGLSLRQHRIIRKQMKLKGREHADSEKLTENREKFRKKVEEQSKNKLIRERKKAARNHQLKESNESKSPQRQQEEKVTNNNTPDLMNDDWGDSDIPIFKSTTRGVV